MILTLEVMGEQAADLGAGYRKVFHAIGGTIGRLPDNDWVFPDPYISGRHALIRYLNGRFFVEDTSTNGICINAPGSRVSKTQAHPLKDGDVLYIDAYRIAVSIRKEPLADDDPLAVLPDPIDAFPDADDTASLVAAPPQPRPRSNLKSTPKSTPKPKQSRIPEAEIEWLGLDDLPAGPKPAAQSEPPARQRGRRDSGRPEVADRARPPAEPEPGRMRAEPEEGVRAAAAPASRHPSRQAVESSSGAASLSPDDMSQLQQLLAAAGVAGVEPSGDLARTCGEVLRVVVEGVMEVLRARERMKDDLRIRSTTFKVEHNNPLKFSANADDAFHNLLVKHNAAYLAPREAFEEALHDVRDHQTALLGAMRLAFEAMLAQFDPQRLQEEFDRQMKGSILGVPAKMRYWDLYRDKYGALFKDADSSFRNLFGNEFAKAYEEHVERLKARQRVR